MISYYLCLLSFLLLIMAIYIFRRKGVKTHFSVTLFMVLVALQIISSIFVFACLQFTQQDIAWSVLYTLTHELTGADITDYLLPGCLLIIATIVILFVIKRSLGTSTGKYYRFDLLASLLALLSFGVSPAVVEFGAITFMPGEQTENDFNKYFITQKGGIDSPQYNLVYIYAESLEQTWFDEKKFPGLLPELTNDIKVATQFTNTEQVSGTGFTIGGIVSSQCGLPLFFPFSMTYSNIVNNFYPDAICLGDILKKSGYTNYFYQGADIHFSDKDVFLKAHGFDHIYGSQQLQARAEPGYRHRWGLYDDTVLDAAWEKFVELSQKKERFSLFTLTVDTHPPTGFISKNCQRTTYSKDGKNISSLAAISCSQEIISRFIRRIRESRWGSQTIVVLSSDHLSMRNDATPFLPEDINKRQDLFTLFRGADTLHHVFTRKRSTLDNGATVLDALGGPGQIGLGRSSLSDISLSEQFSSFAQKIKQWQSNIIALWKVPTMVDNYEVDPANERFILQGKNYSFPFMLRVDDNSHVYPITKNYSELRFDYLVMDIGDRFIWVDRCYVLSWLDDRKASFARSPQWCLARGTKGGKTEIRLLGTSKINEAFEVPKPELDKDKDRQLTLTLRAESSMRYDSPFIRFNLVGHPDYVADIDGLSWVEEWGRWSNEKVSPDITIKYAEPLPAHFRLRLAAKAYEQNIGKPVSIRVGNETRTVLLGAELSSTEVSFENTTGADAITITPPHPQIDTQEGNWRPMDNTGRLIGVGLAELEVIAQK